MASDTIKLYQSAGSPNSRRVRIFLAEKELSVPLLPVDLGQGEQHSEAYRAIKLPIPDEQAALRRWHEKVSARPSAKA